MSATLTNDDEGVLPARAGGAALVLLLEHARPLAGSARHELSAYREVALGRADARTWMEEPSEGGERLVLGIPDARMSQSHGRFAPNTGPRRCSAPPNPYRRRRAMVR